MLTRRGFAARMGGALAAGRMLPEMAYAQRAMIQGNLPKDMVWLNANENPLGPPKSSLTAMAEVLPLSGRYHYQEVRDFYVNLLQANILSERTDRYCEMELGGIPLTLRQCEFGEMVSYFHLYISTKSRDRILQDLRQRGIIVTTVGPYTNFRDPEGRVIKLSEGKTIVS